MIDAGRRLKLVERDNRSGPRVDDFTTHAEIAKHVLERRGVLTYCLHAWRRSFGGLRRREEAERRQLVSVGPPSARRCGLLAGLRSLSPRALRLIVGSGHRFARLFHLSEPGLGAQ